MISASSRAATFGQPGQVDKVQVVTPWGISVWCHEKLAERFLAACRDAVADAWKPQRIDSYNPRPIRGYDGSSLEEWSMHSWALAWDFFVTPPDVSPPGGVWTPDNGVPESFAAVFEGYGFRWGGRWASRQDVPHIEWAEGEPPPLDQPPPPPPPPAPEPVLPRILQEIDMHKPFQLADVAGGVFLFIPGKPTIPLGGLGGVHSILATEPAAEPFAPCLNRERLLPVDELLTFAQRWDVGAK